MKRAATAFASMGCDIVTGGGPGLMQAANEGASVAGASASVGIRVELPFEQDVNPFVVQAFEHETFFTRLQHFVIASDAFVVVPGGIGTVLETLMIWQLLQVRHVDNVPLILVGKMWSGLVEWAKESMQDPRLPLASAADLDIPRCVDSADEAIAIVRDLHRDGRRSSSAGSPLRIQPPLAVPGMRRRPGCPSRPTILAPWTRHRLSSKWAGHSSP